MTLFEQYEEAQEAREIASEDQADQSDMTAAEVEKIVDRMKVMTSENRRGLIDLLGRFCDLMDHDTDSSEEDQEEAYEGVTVGECNDFRKKCIQTPPESRDLIMRGLFDIDQEGRRNEYGNAELRKASMMDLYGSLNEAHQEQIRRYAKLLLENQ